MADTTWGSTNTQHVDIIGVLVMVVTAPWLPFASWKLLSTHDT